MLFLVEVMMLRGGEVKDIIELKRQGLSVSQISAMSGYDRKTIRKYLGNPKIPVYKPRISGGSKLEPFYGYLSRRVNRDKAAISRQNWRMGRAG
jgi:transposase